MPLMSWDLECISYDRNLPLIPAWVFYVTINKTVFQFIVTKSTFITLNKIISFTYTFKWFIQLLLLLLLNYKSGLIPTIVTLDYPNYVIYFWIITRSFTSSLIKFSYLYYSFVCLRCLFYIPFPLSPQVRLAIL